jgi:hypothetical protein
MMWASASCTTRPVWLYDTRSSHSDWRVTGQERVAAIVLGAVRRLG